MKVRDLIPILDAEILCGENYLDQNIRDFFASDLLSDILSYSQDNYVLLTGLTSSQVVPTAELTGAIAIVFVRGKLPPQEAIALARSYHIPILKTDEIMFHSCRKIVEELIKEEKKI